MSVSLVSVVMAVYNGGRFLTPAVESILSQQYKEFELIVMDDGSTDGSGEVLDQIARTDHRLQVVRGDHVGFVAALNRGCELARGEYIARMDADDIASSEWLTTLLPIMEANHSLALLGSGVEIIDEHGITKTTWSPALQDIRSALDHGVGFFHNTVIYRKRVFEEVGRYRPAFADAEDYDLWLRFADRCEVANIQKPLVKYRLHPTQVSVTRIVQNASSALGAKLAAKMRRETGSDQELISLGTIRRETLKQFGVDDQAIDHQIVMHTAEVAKRLMSVGEARSATELLERYCIENESRPIHGRDKAHLQRLLSTLYRRTGQTRRSFVPFGKAFYYDPGTMTSVLWSRFAR